MQSNTTWQIPQLALRNYIRIYASGSDIKKDNQIRLYIETFSCCYKIHDHFLLKKTKPSLLPIPTSVGTLANFTLSCILHIK